MQIGRRIDAAAKAAGLGEGFTGHSGRVGMAQDLAASGVELPELMTAGRWKSRSVALRGRSRPGDLTSSPPDSEIDGRQASAGRRQLPWTAGLG